MYILDDSKVIIKKAQVCTFRELHLEERRHLQEWIANEPSSLGEELLIIQKEFDGFDDTRERLDLLALDKKGNLVIIENKLDDSGRDVTWQAIKYASYCSSLSNCPNHCLCSSWLPVLEGVAEASRPFSVLKRRIAIST